MKRRMQRTIWMKKNFEQWQAMDKAQTEYKKYKAKTLSSVEQDYLDSIKQLEQKGKKPIFPVAYNMHII